MTMRNSLLAGVMALAMTTHANAMNYEYTVRNDGATVITMTGDIQSDEFHRFSEWLAAHLPGRVDPPLYFALNSPGGDVDAALAMAYFIQSTHGMTVVPPGAACASACVFMWAASDNKYWSSTSNIGVHAIAAYKGSFDNNDDTAPAKKLNAGSAALSRLLAMRGAPRFVADAMYSTPNNSVYWLTARDLTAWGAKEF